MSDFQKRFHTLTELRKAVIVDYNSSPQRKMVVSDILAKIALLH